MGIFAINAFEMNWITPVIGPCPNLFAYQSYWPKIPLTFSLENMRGFRRKRLLIISALKSINFHLLRNWLCPDDFETASLNSLHRSWYIRANCAFNLNKSIRKCASWKKKCFCLRSEDYDKLKCFPIVKIKLLDWHWFWQWHV